MKKMNLEKIREITIDFLINRIDFRINSICPPCTICKIEQLGNHNYRSDYFDGLQIICFENGYFEVSEFNAGKENNELHVYTYTKSFIVALKSFMRGNKRKPIKIY